MSPEQVSSNPVDHRTDIYALGVILFEAVTGRKPFAADSFGEMVVQHLTVKPPRPTAFTDVDQPIPPKLESLILLCLAKDRENRPQSIEELGRQLSEILAEQTATEIRVARRRSLRLPLLAASLLVVVAGVVAAGKLLRHSEAAGPVAAEALAPAREAARVQLTFESSPPGAAVLDGDEVLGVTPLTVARDRADAAREFRFTLAGYEPAMQRVSLRGNGRVLVQLAAAAPEARPKERAARKSRKGRQKRKSAARRGTLDPFGD
jgi:serine/threonine-protein kinase